MRRMDLGRMMRGAILGAALALPAGAATHVDRIAVKPVDFDLPLGIAEQVPPGVPASEVFVSDEFCFYYRKDGAFHFIGCVG